MAKTKGLCEICSPKQWKTISTDMLTDGGYPVYGANGVIGCYSEYNHEEPTLLVTCRGATCGTLNICEPYSYVNGNAMALDNLTDEVDIKYLYYYLLNRGFEDVITGSAQPQIVRQSLQKVNVTYPDKERQAEIVTVLERVSELIALRKEQLAKLDQLVKSRFIELFGDGESPIETVEELCTAIVDCPHTTPKYEGELKNPAIRTAEIKKGYIAWETMRYVSDEEYEERIARLKPEEGDIVYGREGTFGNAAILPSGYNFCLGQRVMLLRPDYSKCTSEYLLHAVISDDVYRQAIEKNNASTVAHVNVKDVKQFKIPLPSFDKQNQFAAFVEQTDKSKLAIQQSLDKLELLKKSLMQEYFG